jgi:UBX domain-containing protein 1
MELGKNSGHESTPSLSYLLRLVARMNLIHTVGDIRNFINAFVSRFLASIVSSDHPRRSYPGAASQAYTIGTTFPNRTLDDDSITIEKAGLKNCVIVQRLV